MTAFRKKVSRLENIALAKTAWWMSNQAGLHGCLHAEDVVGAFDRLNRDDVSGLQHCFHKDADNGLLKRSVAALISDLLQNTTQEVRLRHSEKG